MFSNGFYNAQPEKDPYSHEPQYCELYLFIYIKHNHAETRNIQLVCKAESMNYAKT